MHSQVASFANNIAMILQDQGDLDGARELLPRALRILQRTYSPDNPTTQIIAGNLARLPRPAGQAAVTSGSVLLASANATTRGREGVRTTKVDGLTRSWHPGD